MKDLFKYIDVIAVTLGAFLGWYLGAADGFLYTLLAFVCADYVTGVFRAGVERKLSSSIGFKGIAKKVMIFILVGAAHLLDVHILPDGQDLIRTAVIFFYLANEGLSILENSTDLGLPVPEKFRDALKMLNQSANEEEK